jgi:predicted enzyme related to lactoylglutathione lyase
MPVQIGRFVWHELMTPEPQRASDFYTRVVGWSVADAGSSNGDYALFSVAGKQVAGLMTMPEAAASAGAEAGWRSFITVADTDASAGAVTSAGGVLRYGPETIPGIGRFASVTDPQGAAFILFTPSPGSEAARPEPGTPGAVSWLELHTADRARAFDFYQRVFGWVDAGAIPYSDTDIYQIFSLPSGAPLGGMMALEDPARKPGWLCYFSVPALGAAEAVVRDAGGTILVPPQALPNGGWMLHAADPEGSAFALMSQVR